MMVLQAASVVLFMNCSLTLRPLKASLVTRCGSLMQMSSSVLDDCGTTASSGTSGTVFISSSAVRILLLKYSSRKRMAAGSASDSARAVL